MDGLIELRGQRISSTIMLQSKNAFIIDNVFLEKGSKWQLATLCLCCCCYLPDPFRGMGAWRKTMEPQKPGNSPGSGPEVIKRQRVAKE